MNNYIKYILLLFSFFLYASRPGNLHAKEKAGIAVFSFTVNNVQPSYSKAARNSLEYHLFKLNKFHMVEREQIEKVAEELKYKKNGINDSSSAMDIGRRLSADFIIVGNIDKVNDYRITVRTIYIESGEIIFAHSENFKSEDEIDDVIRGLTLKISNGILRYFEYGEIVYLTNKPVGFNLFLGLNYIYPVQEFQDILQPGYGITMRLISENIITNSMLAGIEAGYYKSRGRINSDDSMDFVPIFLDLGYKIISSGNFHFSTLFAGGLTLLTLKHGEGEGFTMEENSKHTSVELIIKMGAVFGYNISKLFQLQMSTEYGVIFEEDFNMKYINYSLGTAVKI